MPEDLLLTVEDVCRATKLGRTTVYALVRRGELPTVRIGRTVRVRRETLQEWLAEQEEAATELCAANYPWGRSL